MHLRLLLLLILAFVGSVASATEEGSKRGTRPVGGYFTGPGTDVWQKVVPPSEAVQQQVGEEVMAISPAFGTVRSGTDFTYHMPTPRGHYSLRIGYVELLYIHPDVRVFSILANGEPLVRNFDLPPAMGITIENYDADGDGRISMTERRALPQHHIQELEVDLDVDYLDLRFLASIELSERVNVAFIEMTGEGLHYFIDCGGDDDLPGDFERATLGQALVARLGSRAFLDLRPQFGEFSESPLGKFSEDAKPEEERVLKPFSSLIGFQADDGARYSLPVYRNFGDDNKPFEKVRETRTLTSIRYDVEFRGVEGSITIRAPYHPGDRKLSTAPYFEIEYAARRIRDDAPKAVRALFFLPVMQKRERKPAPGYPLVGGAIAATVVDGKRVERGLFGREKDIRRLNGRFFHKHRGIWATLDMPIENSGTEVSMIYAAYVADPVLEVEGKPTRFSYTQDFQSVEDVATFAFKRHDDAMKASAVVDGLIDDAILPESLKELCVAAFSSFLVNTYLTVDDAGNPWYSCIEGFCRYHATVDVEYNAAPFYFWFEPTLLRQLLDAWPRFLKQEEIPLRVDDASATTTHWFLSHDVGIDDRVNGQEYPNDMPVEENSNYVLLLHQYWTWVGEWDFVASQRQTVTRLLDYILAADIDGDGFPEYGAANTIDDAPAAVQFAREQTYLAVKSASALLAGAEILEKIGDADAKRDASRYRERVATMRVTLDAEGWLDDHYAVCIDRTTAGLKNPWDNLPEHTAVPREAIPVALGDELPGWDHAHPYTSLGLLYLMRAGMELPIDRDKLLTDLRTAAERCARRYSDSHTEAAANGWVSLNLFRDAVQSYLGDDVLERTERYNALQIYRARAPDVRDRAGYCDSFYNRHLSYYPRGTASLALVDAAAGVTLDRRSNRLTFKPVRAPLKVPLPYLANWSKLQVPWFEVYQEGDSVRHRFTEPELLTSFDIVVDLTLVGGDVTTLPANR